MGNPSHPVIIVVNAGSSSIKLSIFSVGDDEPPRLHTHGQLEDIGGHQPKMKLESAGGELLLDEHFGADEVPDHGAAYAKLREAVKERLEGFSPVAVGHRVVHGGTRFDAPVVIDESVKREIESLTVLAPLHQPHALAGIEAVERIAPDVLQVAGFDTSFHFHRDPLSQLTGLPYEYFEHGIRRFGFHGLSYEYIAKALVEEAPALAERRLVVAHLGNGASLCALHRGKSVDTTMSLTPLDGLPMGTRSGSLDPGILLYLLGRGMPLDELRRLLYYESGLKGLSGISNDMQELLESDEPRARLAVDFFVARIAEGCARMAVALGGLEGLIFTGGIGEHAAQIRARVCALLAPLFGVELDPAANGAERPRLISSTASRFEVRVLPTDEEGMLAEHVWRLWRERQSEH
ncbi:acetate/propionate family kinase [Halotalea alkalilenta]|uniref:Acetate kinase n=1 Tax=Halotalea alkalilenta TaxID=376489 RepID=A0A172YCY0_9GAMM|nr:acetate/propionate family kinase [Halotalea alkalilenta]ANF57064.1 acetate kinase [Halotalea alkalilenta]